MKVEINTILLTKDGRRIGNAIVIGKEGEMNVVKTDYGNQVRLTDEEIDELFHEAYEGLSIEEREFLEETHKNSVTK